MSKKQTKSQTAAVNPNTIVQRTLKLKDVCQVPVVFEALKGVSVGLRMQGVHAAGGLVIKADGIGTRTSPKNPDVIDAIMLTTERARGTGGHAAEHDSNGVYTVVPVKMFPALIECMKSVVDGNKERAKEAKAFAKQQKAKAEASVARAVKKAAKKAAATNDPVIA